MAVRGTFRSPKKSLAASIRVTLSRCTSRTRLVHLDKVTRMDAASDFFGERNVPRTAITMGGGAIVLVAFGEHKAGIVKRAVEGEITPTVAASFLQQHGGVEFVLDPAAG